MGLSYRSAQARACASLVIFCNSPLSHGRGEFLSLKEIMGRTLATFTQLIAQEVSSWAAFRRALRREDQEILDSLFHAAKYHVAAGSYASKASPFEAMVVAMLIEAYKSNTRLEKRIVCLEKERRHTQQDRR